MVKQERNLKMGVSDSFNKSSCPSCSSSVRYLSDTYKKTGIPAPCWRCPDITGKPAPAAAVKLDIFTLIGNDTLTAPK